MVSSSPPRKRRSRENGSSPSSLATVESGDSSPSPSNNRRPLRRRKRFLRKHERWQFVFSMLIIALFLVGFFYLLFSLVRNAYVQRQESLNEDRSESSSSFQIFSREAPVCRPVGSDYVSYSLVTQLSKDRLWMMEHHCLRWGPHPISIAVLTNETQVETQRQLTEMGCSLEHIKVQVVSGYTMEDYPVNLLRNKALSAVSTSHVVYLDVDFWGSVDLYETLMKERIRKLLANDDKAALVIPAFMLMRQCDEWRECPEDNIPQMPDTKKELIELLGSRDANRFDPTNVGGHGSTMYKEWLTQPVGELLPISCVLSNRYEPYLVFRYCRDLPPFQEQFTGYGKNKMTWAMQLRRSGWAFWQLGFSFAIHYPHLDSQARLSWNGPDGIQIQKPKDPATDWLRYKRGVTDHLFVQFRNWLHANVPDQTRLFKCDDSADDDSRLWISPRDAHDGETNEGT